MSGWHGDFCPSCSLRAAGAGQSGSRQDGGAPQLTEMIVFPFVIGWPLCQHCRRERTSWPCRRRSLWGFSLTSNVAPCLVQGPPPPPQTNWVPFLTFVKIYLVGLLLNTIDTLRVLHIEVAVSWFLRAPTQCWGPPRKRSLKSGTLVLKSLGPRRALFSGPILNRVRHYYRHAVAFFLVVCHNVSAQNAWS